MSFNDASCRALGQCPPYPAAGGRQAGRTGLLRGPVRVRPTLSVGGRGRPSGRSSSGAQAYNAPRQPGREPRQWRRLDRPPCLSPVPAGRPGQACLRRSAARAGARLARHARCRGLAAPHPEARRLHSDARTPACSRGSRQAAAFVGLPDPALDRHVAGATPGPRAVHAGRWRRPWRVPGQVPRRHRLPNRGGSRQAGR